MKDYWAIGTRLILEAPGWLSLSDDIVENSEWYA